MEYGNTQQEGRGGLIWMFKVEDGKEKEYSKFDLSLVIWIMLNLLVRKDGP
jgi:hypothetical protein